MTSADPSTAVQHQFPCPQCGANLQFAPGTDSLRCPYCGTLVSFKIAREIIPELDYFAYISRLQNGGEPGGTANANTVNAGAAIHEMLAVRCTNCGAETTL